MALIRGIQRIQIKDIPKRILLHSTTLQSSQNVYFRTGGLGTDTPHETPPMRRNNGSRLNGIPQLNLDTGGGSAECESISNQDTSTEDISTQRQLGRKHDELFEKALVKTLMYGTSIFDTLTLPIYAAIQQPWKKLEKHNSPKGILVNKEKMIYATATTVGTLHKEMQERNIDTMEKVFAYASSKHGDRNCLGSREIINEEEVLDPQSGKMMKKYELGDYTWTSYKETDSLAKDLSAGFASLGMKPKGKIALFAETRQEWLMTAMGAFKQNLRIVTVFTTLGDDGVIHALNETEAPCLVTTEEMLPRCMGILKQVPSIKTLIYMNSKGSKSADSYLNNLPSDVNVISFSDLVEQGRQNPVEDVKPEKEDQAIIMYTSGSTGAPKGVILTHNNLVSGVRSVLDVLEKHDNAVESDSYIAYLPLAHVLELMSEAICFVQGIPIGYSSPLTLTDQSLAIKAGTRGDATVLKPTIMAGVPLVLERICKGIQTKITEKGRIAQLMFEFFYKYKTEWVQKGYETPLVNKIFFEKIRQVVGGRVRFMAVGSAPLAPETHEFIRTVLCCPVCLGYAMTESSSCGSFAISHDLTVGRVGPPVYSNHIRLVNWEEGGYRVTDQPYPRGEIILGGDNIALGYYKNPESTDFYEEDGKRWIKTGDIGEVHPDGVFKIIDRKKDLVKLSHGEYISLGKIESVIKSCVYVENACACADSAHSYPVALIVPAQQQIVKLAEELDIQFDSYDELCRDPRIENAVLEEIQETGRQLNLSKFEIPRKIHLCPVPWLPQSGLVTAAFKIRRNHVYKHYERQIEHMYNSS